MTPARPARSDALVVGAGPAGAAVAGLLARRGYDVVLLDRGRTPAATGAESLSPGVHAVLADLGLQARVHAAGLHRNLGSVLSWGDDGPVWPTSYADSGPYGFGYHVDHHEFTGLLVERAAEAGAAVRDDVTVSGPVVQDGVVAGVRCQGGQTVYADVVVDASGLSRVVAGRFASPDPRRVSGRPFAITRTRIGGVSLSCEEERHLSVVYKVAGRAAWCWLTPLGRDEVEVGRLVPTDDDTGDDGTGDDGTGARATSWPECVAGTGLTDRLVGDPVVRATAHGRWVETSPDVLCGPGWLSVGDAAGTNAPVFGETATTAILAAQSAAEAVDLLFGGRWTRARVLEGYASCYGRALDCVRRYAGFYLDPARRDEVGDDVTRGVVQLLNSPAMAGEMARLRGALEGVEPLFAVECPEGPLVASLAIS